MGYPVDDFLLLVLGVPLELFPVGVHKGLGVTLATAEECLEFVPCDRDRGFGVMSLLVLLSVEADPVSQEGRRKRNPERSHGSSSSKIVLTLLTKVVAVHVRLSALYVWRTGLQLLSVCLGNDGSWSGSGSRNKCGNKSGSGYRSFSLQNSLKNPLQVILGVLEDTSSSKSVSDGGFGPRESSGLVGQFITRLGRWRGIRRSNGGSDGGSDRGTLAAGISVASD